MAHMALQILVGTALTDPQFCHDLLNGRRRTLLGQFDLTEEEREAVLGVEAESIQEFAAQLWHWLTAQENLLSPIPMAAVPGPSPLASRVGRAWWQ